MKVSQGDYINGLQEFLHLHVSLNRVTVFIMYGLSGTHLNSILYILMKLSTQVDAPNGQRLNISSKPTVLFKLQDFYILL